MVRLHREGVGIREIARRYRVSHSTVLRWINHAGVQELDVVDFSGGVPGAGRAHNRVTARVEREVLAARQKLRKQGVLGEYGAEAVRRHLEERGRHPPSLRTIGRIFERKGALDGRARIRQKAPPPGWYIPDVAGKKAELDSFDYVEDLRIKGGCVVDVLTGVSLHGGLVSAWPSEGRSACFSCEKLIERWREYGLPAYAQFDNGTVFCGGRHPGTIGSVMRLCLSLDVVPVFVPPCETGFQAAIESFNGKWQKYVWRRREHRNLTELSKRSGMYVSEHQAKCEARISGAPARRPFPQDFRFEEKKIPKGRMIFIRRTNDSGSVELLGRKYFVRKDWAHRLVRCEMCLKKMTVSIYGLRRRAPDEQPLLKKCRCKKFSAASGL